MRMVTYQTVWAIIQASTPRVTASTATRRATPIRKVLETIFLHPPVQRGPGQAQLAGGAADIAGMLRQRPDNGGLFDLVQPGIVGGGGGGRLRRRLGQGKVRLLQKVAL